MPPTKKDRTGTRPGAKSATTTVTESGSGATPVTCTCCEPPNLLVMRPDLGTLPDSSAEYALCVLHDPEPTVYRNRGDGEYVQMPRLSLSAAGDLVDADGTVVARVSGDGFQRLTTVDDDGDDQPAPAAGSGSGSSDGPERASRPRTMHVDLTEDDFYR